MKNAREKVEQGNMLRGIVTLSFNLISCPSVCVILATKEVKTRTAKACSAKCMCRHLSAHALDYS